MKLSIITSIFLFFNSYLFSQKIEIIQILDNTYQSSMRGLFSVNDKVAWASGTKGVIMKINKDEKWEAIQDT